MRKIGRLRKLLRFATFILLGAAVYTEARKKPEERTGQGEVGGVVPYDFRPPTLARFKAAMWNREDDRLVMPQAFGVGWTINFARAKELYEQSQAQSQN
ncbi:MAG: DUF5808 domain-containing protein [Actinomycetota bacterium]